MDIYPMSTKRPTNMIEIEKFVKEFQEKVQDKKDLYSELISDVIETQFKEVLKTKNITEIKATVFALYLVIGIVLEKLKNTGEEVGLSAKFLEGGVSDQLEHDEELGLSFIKLVSSNSESENEDSSEEMGVEELYSEDELLKITTSKDERN